MVGNRSSRRLSKLPRPFYLRPTLTVARDLPGRYLIRRIGRKLLIGKIVEVEAYLGELDPASHAYRGRTKRNEVMFDTGGHLYVYFTYGMHFCGNVVTGREGKGRAVLLRAVEPIEGIDTMIRNREFDAPPQETSGGKLRGLTNGPAKLCKAFGIGREQNGADLLGREVFITRGENVRKVQLASSCRIGLTTGKDKRWRFYIRRNPFVSRKREWF